MGLLLFGQAGEFLFYKLNIVIGTHIAVELKSLYCANKKNENRELGSVDSANLALRIAI